MVNDYTGMHIGDLVVLEQMEPVAGKRCRQYLCRCSCGNHCIKTNCQLAKAYYRGAGAHCGCKSKRNRRAWGNSVRFGNRRYQR